MCQGRNPPKVVDRKFDSKSDETTHGVCTCSGLLGLLPKNTANSSCVEKPATGRETSNQNDPNQSISITSSKVWHFKKISNSSHFQNARSFEILEGPLLLSKIPSSKSPAAGAVPLSLQDLDMTLPTLTSNSKYPKSVLSSKSVPSYNLIKGLSTWRSPRSKFRDYSSVHHALSLQLSCTRMQTSYVHCWCGKPLKNHADHLQR